MTKKNNILPEIDLEISIKALLCYNVPKEVIASMLNNLNNLIGQRNLAKELINQLAKK